jgi:hypothetical protein
MNDIIVKIGEALEKVKLGNSYLFFGALILLSSIVTDHILGIKIGFITFVYGGIFRLTNIITNLLKVEDSKKDSPQIIKTIFRFLIWIGLLFSYVYFIYKYTPLF